ncbi:MAG: carboxypeptidase-like regulatory domain-containing protein [Planctomycetota bacterium]
MRIGRRVFAGWCAAAAALAQDAPQTDVLRGVVVDGQGVPVAGLVLDVCRRDGGDFSCLDLEFGSALRKVQAVRTGKNGSFALQVPRGVPFELRGDDGSHAPIAVHDAYGGEDLRIALAAPATVVATIVDATGAPYAGGGSVRGWEAGRYAVDLGAIDDRGVWRSDRLAAGQWTFEFATFEASRPEWQRSELVAGAEQRIDLAVKPGFAARGRVTDAATGRPIAGARVGEGWTLNAPVLTDADGRYELRGFGAKTVGELYVRAGGYGAAALRTPNVKADLEKDFALEPGRAARGRLLGVADAPVAGAYVAAVGFASDDVGTFDWCAGRTDAQGRYELTGLRPSVAYALVVLPQDGVRLVFDLPRTQASQDLAVPDLRVRPGRYVSGTVVDDDGHPVAGMSVVLRGANPDRCALVDGIKAETSMVDNYVATRVARTDTLGRIHFANVAPGSYVMEWMHGRSRDSAKIEVGADGDPAVVSFTVAR